MIELKPEDVMRALESHYKEWQIPTDGIDHCERDCPYYRVDNCSVKLVKDAIALLREMKKQIRELEADVENYKSIAEYQQNCNVKRYHTIKEKDAEIERLKNRITCQVILPDEKLEEIKNECLKRVELDIKAIRAEAIDEFAAGCVATAIGIGTISVVCLESILNVAKNLKGEKE